MTEDSANHLLPPEGNSDTSMVFGMRLVLAIAALLTLMLVPAEVGLRTPLTWLVFSAYGLHSVALLLAFKLGHAPFWQGKLVYWLDICWYTLMVFCSGGNNSFFFPFYFFAMLASAFQWGFDEGARISLTSVILLSIAVLLAPNQIDHSRLLLRDIFLLGLGYMIAYWGGLGLAQKRRLALLRDVSRLSNPRFGVDQTIASVLDKTRLFYRASSCILLMRDSEPEHWLLRSARAPDSGRAFSRASIGTAAAAPLLAFTAQQTVLYTQAFTPRQGWHGETRALARATAKWSKLDGHAGDELADLLEARSFISAPLPLRQGEGRIFVVAPQHGFSRADALFLSHIGAQVFPVIENIELLDRLASEAAFRERQKIARDLHDTTIQPYIGLRHGISAMRNAAAPDNPLIGELDKMIAMTTQVIGDMRQFAKSVQHGRQPDEPELMVALRRQAQQVRQFYGIDISIGSQGPLAVNDRLAAEVFQIVNEGMSNIRKHTRARHGAVHLSNSDGALRICIENDNLELDEAGADAETGAGQAGPVRRLAANFMPSSIAERAAALGGSVQVALTALGNTAVNIAIPV